MRNTNFQQLAEQHREIAEPRNAGVMRILLAAMKLCNP
jgi:hypothetical protein